MTVTFIAQNINEGTTDGGGSGRSLYLIASGLCERGYDVRVVTISSHRNTLDEPRPFELVESAELAPRRPVVYDAKIPGTLSEQEVGTDLFHMFEPQLLPGASRYASADTPPIVGRLNSLEAFCFNTAKMDGECHKHCSPLKRFRHYDGPAYKNLALVPFMAYAERRLDQMNEIPQLFAQSPPIRRMYTEVGVDRPDMMTIPNMYDEAFEAPDPDVPAAMQTDGVHLLFAGRLIYAKGIETFLRAAKQLPPEAKVHIVGDGYERENLEQFVADHGLTNVTFHGRIHHYNLPGFYEGADVYVHPPYLPDSCPRAVLEAMAYGTPLVVSDIGAPPWMGGDACLTFPPGDHEALADRLTTLCTDPARREELANAAAVERERFAPDRILDRYEAGYERVLSA